MMLSLLSASLLSQTKCPILVNAFNAKGRWFRAFGRPHHVAAAVTTKLRLPATPSLAAMMAACEGSDFWPKIAGAGLPILVRAFIAARDTICDAAVSLADKVRAAGSVCDSLARSLIHVCVCVCECVCAVQGYFG
jgi:hypothetical protein